MSYVLIIGAKSDIAKEVARIYAKNGYNLYLVARDCDSITDLAKDIKIRSNVNVKLCEFDIAKFETHQSFYNGLEEKPLGVIVVAGYMSEQKECENNFEKTLNTINVNYTGAVSILNIIANDMEKNKNGFIIGVSSVAGDRGRKANYIYGSSKAAFSTYLSGLRNRLFESKVQVLTVKPGFVATKMTAGLDLPAKLTAQPENVAEDIFVAQQKGKDILYTKSIWGLVMLVIKHIPEFIFKKMSI
ncbi:SDR family oxidoreductase [Aliarcobacter cibarius]|uniref:SDR family oxidoreductase n=1 Tax=Aliarcobacter cibarius TaxID=255507 RepID=A0ABY2V975_9BACT|nr:SDR family oxidoreductase [Aliarcobacter cibarius]TLT01304.1 SDR family oxidoreductase [Aliarcobacter cibarius]TLT01709.1 SDR family oxidoreductase [Aliarcobacter cibarius]